MSQAHRKLFGTDGMRGAFGIPPLDRATVTELAHALCDWLLLRSDPPSSATIVLGGDSRESTPVLCRWISQVLEERAVTVLAAGQIPTPGVAFLARERGADLGVIVSASHNPYPDNGIKLVGGDGFKLSADQEHEIEQRALARLDGAECDTSDAPASSTVATDDGAELRALYLEHLALSTGSDPTPLAGLKVVVDSGNGAASGLAAELFGRLGANVVALSDQPNGRNVNDDCGSTAPEKAAASTAEAGADIGFAFDGDADRVILCDERGNVLDGDTILYLWALDLKSHGSLGPATIVATSMSNLGLERALADHQIAVHRCDVGDRQVVEALRAHGLKLGGEQSGHIIHLDLTTTGDGLLTAAHMADLVRRRGRPLSELAADLQRYPQLLRNVRVQQKIDFAQLPQVSAVARSVADRLGDDGRLVLRYSGTEPLARIMLEGPELSVIEAMSDELAEVIERSTTGPKAAHQEP